METALQSSTETVKTTETMKSTANDNLTAYKIRQHIWRYPIDPIPDWYKNARSKDITKDGKLAYTVSMTENPELFGGVLEGYNARHEEGNLFSYPTKMDNIPDFTDVKSTILSINFADTSKANLAGLINNVRYSTAFQAYKNP